MKKKLTFGLVFLLLVTVISGCSGQKDVYPSKSIEFIVPWGPGGGSDIAMRVFATHLGDYLEQSVVVVNKPGVSGTIGLAELTEKPANGYTIGMIHEGLIVAHHSDVTELNYDSFIPIASVTDDPQYLVAHIDAPYDTVEELQEYARANPGKVKLGMTLNGLPHMWGAILADEMGAEINLIPYEGVGERMQAAAGGFVDLLVAEHVAAEQFVENGDLKFLASCTEERQEITPDIPTLSESGIDMIAIVRRGIVVPKGTPQEIVDVLAEAIEEVGKSESFINELNKMQMEAYYMNQKDYITYLEQLNESTANIADMLK